MHEVIICYIQCHMISSNHIVKSSSSCFSSSCSCSSSCSSSSFSYCSCSSSSSCCSSSSSSSSCSLSALERNNDSTLLYDSVFGDAASAIRSETSESERHSVRGAGAGVAGGGMDRPGDDRDDRPHPGLTPGMDVFSLGCTVAEVCVCVCVCIRMCLYVCPCRIMLFREILTY